MTAHASRHWLAGAERSLSRGRISKRLKLYGAIVIDVDFWARGFMTPIDLDKLKLSPPHGHAGRRPNLPRRADDCFVDVSFYRRSREFLSMFR